MIYLLDTNTCIQYINRRNQTVHRYITSRSPDDIAICDIVKFELYFGAYNSSRVEENQEFVQRSVARLCDRSIPPPRFACI